jgi:hypothetical protein
MDKVNIYIYDNVNCRKKKYIIWLSGEEAATLCSDFYKFDQ